jgi:hypothetical protein
MNSEYLKYLEMVTLNQIFLRNYGVVYLSMSFNLNQQHHKVKLKVKNKKEKKINNY